MQYDPLKRWYPTAAPQDVTAQKTTTWGFAVRTSNLTTWRSVHCKMKDWIIR